MCPSTPCGALIRPVTVAVGGLSKIKSSFPQAGLTSGALASTRLSFCFWPWWVGGGWVVVGGRSAHLQPFLKVLLAHISKHAVATFSYALLGVTAWSVRLVLNYIWYCFARTVGELCWELLGMLPPVPVTASPSRSTSPSFRRWRDEQVTANPTQPWGSFGSLLAARHAWG